MFSCYIQLFGFVFSLFNEVNFSVWLALVAVDVAYVSSARFIECSWVFALLVGLTGMDLVIDIATHILIFLHCWTQSVVSCIRRVRKIAKSDN